MPDCISRKKVLAAWERHAEKAKAKQRIQAAKDAIVEAARDHRQYANRAQGQMQWICECPICKALAELDAAQGAQARGEGV